MIWALCGVVNWTQKINHHPEEDHVKLLALYFKWIWLRIDRNGIRRNGECWPPRELIYRYLSYITQQTIINIYLFYSSLSSILFSISLSKMLIFLDRKLFLTPLRPLFPPPFLNLFLQYSYTPIQQHIILDDIIHMPIDPTSQKASKQTNK